MTHSWCWRHININYIRSTRHQRQTIVCVCAWLLTAIPNTFASYESHELAKTWDPGDISPSLFSNQEEIKVAALKVAVDKNKKLKQKRSECQCQSKIKIGQLKKKLNLPLLILSAPCPYFYQPPPPNFPQVLYKNSVCYIHELTMIKYKKVTYYSTMKLSQPLPPNLLPMHAQEL